MIFEFDPEKSISNKAKHGIDFEEAQELWEDENGLIVATKSDDEDRYYLMAMIGKKNWTTVFTLRVGNIRIISVRRSRKNEKEDYFSRRI